MKNQKPREVRKVRSVPIKADKEITRLGNGDFQTGIIKVTKICRQINKDTTEGYEVKKRVLMSDCNQLMNDLQDLFPRNHYVHFGNFVPFFSKFLDTGVLDYNILRGGRKEKSLDEVKSDGKVKGV